MGGYMMELVSEAPHWSGNGVKNLIFPTFHNLWSLTNLLLKRGTFFCTTPLSG